MLFYLQNATALLNGFSWHVFRQVHCQYLRRYLANMLVDNMKKSDDVLCDLPGSQIPIPNDMDPQIPNSKYPGSLIDPNFNVAGSQIPISNDLDPNLPLQGPNILGPQLKANCLFYHTPPPSARKKITKLVDLHMLLSNPPPPSFPFINMWSTTILGK